MRENGAGINRFVVVVLMSLVTAGECARGAGSSFAWQRLPDVPPVAPATAQEGLAGPFAGVIGDTLILAGGANFPADKPWEGGAKRFYADIFVLEDASDSQKARWSVASSLRLPRPLAYGAAAEAKWKGATGIVFAGGADGDRCYEEVYLVRWDAASQSGKLQSLPAMPQPLAFMGYASDGKTLYVAGGQEDPTGASTRHFWRLDLSGDRNSTDTEWEILEPWPGPSRVLPVCALQNNGQADCFYLFSGRTVSESGELTILTDAYCFDLSALHWTQVRDVQGEKQDGTDGRSIQAGTALALGNSHIVTFGGDDSPEVRERFAVLNRIAALQAQARNAGDPQRKQSLLAEADALRPESLRRLREQPRFPGEILAYHTITDTWVEAGTMPDGGIVTTRAVPLGDAVILPSGEIRPGVRTPEVLLGALSPAESRFGWVNGLVLAVYLILLVAMGVFFSRREKGTKDFFLAGRRIPWWAAGMSIYATQLSAITFVALPSVAFASDFAVFPSMIAILLFVPIVVFFYLPFYRRLDLTTAYEYLEKRFGLTIRLVGSVSFVIYQLGRMAIVIFLPALALAAITGIDIYLCLLIMGVLSVLYTTLGGMEAVVWTDVLQVIVLWGGMLGALVVIFTSEGGAASVLAQAAADDKFRVFRWDFSWTELTTWGVILGSFALQFGPYTTDQAVVQRYLTTRDEKAAARGIWLNGVLCIPFGLLFFVLGAALYVFFRNNPGSLQLGMQNDQVFPIFMAYHLPVGVSGLVIAGVFAASMSSLDSSMHSVSTAVTFDFYRRFRTGASDEACLRLARWLVVGAGVLAVGVACVMARYDIRSLFFQFQKVLGLLTSGLVGAFILGIFTRRANTAGLLVGMVASTVLLAYFTFWTRLHFYWYAVFGISTCVVVGYLMSLVLGSRGPEKDLRGLTWPAAPKARDVS